MYGDDAAADQLWYVRPDLMAFELYHTAVGEARVLLYSD